MNVVTGCRNITSAVLSATATTVRLAPQNRRIVAWCFEITFLCTEVPTGHTVLGLRWFGTTTDGIASLPVTVPANDVARRTHTNHEDDKGGRGGSQDPIGSHNRGRA